MPYCLRTLDQQHAVELHQTSVNSIGTDPENTVPIQPDFGLAPRHFSIRLGQGSPFLEDHTGGERTLINGQPVQTHSLRSGDIIRAGSLTLVFTGEDTSSLRSLSPLPEISERPSTGGLSPLPKPPAPEGFRSSGPMPLPKPEPKVNSMSPATSAMEFFQSGDAPLKHKNTAPIPRITGRVSLSRLDPPTRPDEAGSDFFVKHTGSVPRPKAPADATPERPQPTASLASEIAQTKAKEAKVRRTPWLSMSCLLLLVIAAVAAFVYRESLMGSAASAWMERLPVMKDWAQGVANNR